jgi:hypothetical protein
MIMAGAAEPAVSSGFFNAKPMVKGVGLKSKRRSYTVPHTGVADWLLGIAKSVAILSQAMNRVQI